MPQAAKIPDWYSRPSNAAAPQWEPRKLLGGHMTKGQRAINPYSCAYPKLNQLGPVYSKAVAKIYPDTEQGRLLPAGAMAGWNLHPLETRRLTTAHTQNGHLGA